MRRWAGAGVAAVFLFLTIASVTFVSGPTRGAPTVDVVVIVDAPGGAGAWVSARDYVFGDTDLFWAAGYNNTTGYVQDVPAYWWTNYDPVGGFSGRVIRTNVTYGPSVKVFTNGYGVARLNVYVNPNPGNRTYLANQTGPLRVSVDNVDAVVVRSDRGGMGTWVGPTLYSLGDRDVFYAAAYNDTSGFLGDIVSNWTASNPAVGYLWPTGNASQGCDGGTTGACYPLVNFYAAGLGYTYVTAEPVGTALSNTTGKLTVTTITVDYVQIRDAPSGGGAVLGSRTYYTAEQDTFYAASYNHTLGYLGDVVGNWTSNDTAVCEVRGYFGGSAHGSSVQLLLKSPGTCAVSVAAFPPTGTVSNTTGALTVLGRTLVTVDDSGGADFTKIQDAVDFASDGYTVFVYAGTYPENVVVRKELEITGEEKQGASTQTVVLDGGGGAVALFLGADRVVVHNLTIRNAEVGVYNDRTNNTRLYDSVVRDYGTGVYENRTLNGWIAHNLITVGRIGVAADHAYDDAIRWNEISYNSQYGGKGYNAHLRNCFNWNNLHHNKVAYFYDPSTDLPPMEFDGNVITDNEVGVKVENSSAIRITNNTITGGSEGVQLLNSSSEVASNTIAGVGIGIRCRASGSNLTGNAISAQATGIVCEGGAPRIEGNDLTVASGQAMVLSSLDGAIVRGNDAHGGTIRIVNSHLAVLAPVDSLVILEDSTYDAIALDATSRVEVRHTVRVRAVAPDGTAVAGASVEVRDARNVVVFGGPTDAAGYAPAAGLVTEVLTAAGTESRNPFTFAVSGPGGSGSLTLIVLGPMVVVVTVRPAIALAAVAALAVATAAAAALSGVFAVERSRYALLALFLPLYSRLSRDKVLESYNRGRVFEFIELNPGAHFNGILAALGLNNGSLVYHLEVLQREGLVRSRQEGMYRRFYPRGTEPPPLLENGTTEAQQRVLKTIEEMPGITQKELARFLGLRQSTLAYQIERLAAMGYIEGVRVGRHVAYRARPKGT